jgi:hypothetical protein
MAACPSIANGVSNCIVIVVRGAIVVLGEDCYDTNRSDLLLCSNANR